eukprot:gene2588-30978_t
MFYNCNTQVEAMQTIGVAPGEEDISILQAARAGRTILIMVCQLPGGSFCTWALVPAFEQGFDAFCDAI